MLTRIKYKVTERSNRTFQYLKSTPQVKKLKEDNDDKSGVKTNGTWAIHVSQSRTNNVKTKSQLKVKTNSCQEISRIYKYAVFFFFCIFSFMFDIWCNLENLSISCLISGKIEACRMFYTIKDGYIMDIKDHM